MGFKKLIDLDLLDRFLTGVKALIPTKTSDLTNDSGFVSAKTNQTYTDAEKSQARSNIDAARPWVLLWENASLDSSFGYQTLPLDLSNYSEIKITTGFKGGLIPQYSDVAAVGHEMTIITFGSVTNSSGSAVVYRRLIQYDPTTGVIFNNCYKKSTSSTAAGETANNVMIPFHVYAR